MSSNGPHLLIVEPFDPDDATDRFDVEHPEGCPTRAQYEGPNGEDILTYSCAVGAHLDDAGIDGYFMHADDPSPYDYRLERVPPGRHEIEAWIERRQYAQGVEYDGGLRLVELATS